MTPEIEPGIFGKAIDWVVAGIGALGTTVWGFLRSDINRAHIGVAEVRNEIRNLYAAAEDDRKETRNQIDVAVHRVTETMRLDKQDIMHAISEVARHQREIPRGR